MLGRLQPGRTKPATAAHDAGSSGYWGPSPGYPLAAPVTGARCWRGALSWCSARCSVNWDRRPATRCPARSPLVPGGTGSLALPVRGQEPGAARLTQRVAQVERPLKWAHRELACSEGAVKWIFGASPASAGGHVRHEAVIASWSRHRCPLKLRGRALPSTGVTRSGCCLLTRESSPDGARGRNWSMSLDLCR